MWVCCVGGQHRYNLPADYVPPTNDARPHNASQFLQRFFVMRHLLLLRAHREARAAALHAMPCRDSDEDEDDAGHAVPCRAAMRWFAARRRRAERAGKEVQGREAGRRRHGEVTGKE